MIPTQSSIKVAKERRERLRKTGKTVDEDFVSLSLTQRSDVDQGPHPESRLMREDDEVGEGDDEYAEYTSAQERIALGKKSRKVEARQRRDAMEEMIADAWVSFQLLQSVLKLSQRRKRRRVDGMGARAT